MQVRQPIDQFLADRGLRPGVVEVVLRQAAAQHFAVDVFHHEEGRAEQRVVVARDQHRGHRHGAAVQRAQDPGLAQHVVRAAGDRGRGGAAHDPAHSQAGHAEQLAGGAAADRFEGELRVLAGLPGQPAGEGGGVEIHVVQGPVPGSQSASPL